MAFLPPSVETTPRNRNTTQFNLSTSRKDRLPAHNFTRKDETSLIRGNGSLEMGGMAKLGKDDDSWGEDPGCR
jgi:hypothetical protein